jgi:acyl-coenzyme A synthetase/AMP-(fatty) acid ligase
LRQSFPLVAHRSLDGLIAFRDGQGITVRRFLADVHRVAGLLGGGGHVLNLCGDRYRFMVGLAAAMVGGKTSLLPSSHAPEMLRALAEFAPDSVCLADACAPAAALPVIPYPEDEAPQAKADPAVPLIAGKQAVAYVFTSGSTGLPVPHLKTWGSLVRNVRAEAGRLGMVEGRPWALVATVPPQHMYGLESSVLLAMQSGGAVSADRHFFPLDICAAINAAPRPRLLVTTPFHLRSLLAGGQDVPPVDLLLSATAPISEALVRAAEQQFAAPLLEIYGCTESGQLASRRPARSAEWRLFPGVRLSFEQGRAWADGGHVEGREELGDVLEPVAEDRFLLHGRTADWVNIAGHRSSLAYLNHQLNAIPGVLDGVFFMPAEECPERVARLTALVVAPGLDAESLIRALRERIHPAFLPRPLVFVDALPRNGTGKLPREGLAALAQASPAA